LDSDYRRDAMNPTQDDLDERGKRICPGRGLESESSPAVSFQRPEPNEVYGFQLSECLRAPGRDVDRYMRRKSGQLL
jgi:hypothetical protein